MRIRWKRKIIPGHGHKNIAICICTNHLHGQMECVGGRRSAKKYASYFAGTNCLHKRPGSVGIVEWYRRCKLGLHVTRKLEPLQVQFINNARTSGVNEWEGRILYCKCAFVNPNPTRTIY